MKEQFGKFLETHDLYSGRLFASEDLDELRKKGLLLEDFLDYLNTHHNLVLHGSHVPFNGPIKPSFRSGWKTYFTEFGSIALLKSVLSNKGANLGYPMNVERKARFPVNITGATDQTIKNKGFVYLVQREPTFIPGQGNIELIKPCSGSGDVVPYASKLEVLLGDFEQRHEIKIRS